MESKVKAIGIEEPGDISKLKLVEIPLSTLGPRDLLIKVKAVSVNPVDYKKRMYGFWEPKPVSKENPIILGYDASGEVLEVGSQVKFYKKGDLVYYAGDVMRKGTNANIHIVDERIVGQKPKSLSHADASALPLTGLTAWEGLAENLGIPENFEANKNKHILIIAGAGGVGSIAIQLCKKVFGIKVIATASKPDSIKYCKDLGADYVINHSDIKKQLDALGIKQVEFIFNCYDMTSKIIEEFAQVIAPLGKIVGISWNEGIVLMPLFAKRATISMELMFSRSMLQYDIEAQKTILDRIAELIDKKAIISTVKVIKKFNLENLKEAHQISESGKAIGKIVLDGVDAFFGTK